MSESTYKFGGPPQRIIGYHHLISDPFKENPETILGRIYLVQSQQTAQKPLSSILVPQHLCFEHESVQLYSRLLLHKRKGERSLCSVGRHLLRDFSRVLTSYLCSSLRLFQPVCDSALTLKPIVLMGPSAEGCRPIFPNLRSFECLGNSPSVSSRLRSYERFRDPSPPIFRDPWSRECRRGRTTPIPRSDSMIALPHVGLHSLTMPYPCDYVFPQVQCFADLESLRLVMSPRPYRQDLPNNRCPHCEAPVKYLSGDLYKSISRLSVQQHDDAKFPSYIWNTLEFPKLEVLNLQGLASTSVSSVYSFVQKHSTLLEVNIGFLSIELRLEALIKLIEGTGIWDPTGNVALMHQLVLSGSKDAPDSPQVIDFEGSLVRFPDDIPGKRVVFRRFGFIREPLTPDATEWRSPKASSLPRYRATSLALQISDRHQVALGDDFERTCPNLPHIHEFLSLSQYFPELRELRVESRADCPENSDFTTLMVR